MFSLQEIVYPALIDGTPKALENVLSTIRFLNLFTRGKADLAPK
tara:strand:+ start:1092 stop:1223 length:132 start_codon:yes stop_codon:yes gene_type:complete